MNEDLISESQLVEKVVCLLDQVRYRLYSPILVKHRQIHGTASACQQVLLF